MEDKMFELLSKMYGEFSEFRKDMNEFRKDMNEFKKETKEDIQGLKNDIMRLENTVDIKTEVLFDGYKQTYEKVGIVKEKVDEISAKVEKQDVEIRVIKGNKKAR